jgi:hypothetical protein
MNCQDYREWIEDAALGAIDNARRAQLDTHLAECPECCRAFEAAQKLYAAIDQGVAARVEGKPSADFAARVRMRLAGEGEKAQLRWWRRSIWIPALGSAVLALLLLSIWIARRPGGQRQPTKQIARTTAPAATSASNVRPPEQAKVARPPAAPAAPRRSARVSTPTSQNRPRRQSTPDSEAPPLQVQVQAGQWAAVTSLYRAGQAGRLEGAAEASAAAEQPLQVKPVEVPPLVVAEIQDPKPVGSEPESTNVQDR